MKHWLCATPLPYHTYLRKTKEQAYPSRQLEAVVYLITKYL